MCVELWNETVRQRLCSDAWSSSFGVENVFEVVENAFSWTLLE